MLNNEVVKHNIQINRQGKALLAACGPNQLAYINNDIQQSYFTQALLDAMLGSAADEQGCVTVARMYDYIAAVMEVENKSTPVFKGDFTGRIILGSGFEPVERIKDDESQLRKIILEGKNHVESYYRLASSSPSLEAWKQYGYLEASKALLPIIRWFDKKFKDHPVLRKNRDFEILYNDVLDALRRLNGLNDGTVTSLGNVIKEIGSGTFGTVYKVKSNSPDGVMYAYKILHPKDITREEKVKRFKRGFEGMEQLNHPNIVKVVAYTDCPIGFSMDYIDGPNLREFSGAYNLFEHSLEIFYILYIIARTLEHAHDRGVIHRDVKPENIVLKHDATTDKWTPFLTDFDLVWFSTASKITKEEFGTYLYTSPEQHDKFGSTIARKPTTDIYAFGQVCLFMLCLEDPKDDRNESLSLLERKLSAWQIKQAAKVVYSLYEKCSQRDPALRPENMKYVSEQIIKILEIIKNHDVEAIISLDSFIENVIAYSVGIKISNEDNFHCFVSPSSACQVCIEGETLRDGRINITLGLTMNRQLAASGQRNFEHVRAILNRKIESVIKGSPEISMQQGSSALYEVNIKIRGLTPNIVGVQKVTSILATLIAKIEQTV